MLRKLGPSECPDKGISHAISGAKQELKFLDWQRLTAQVSLVCMAAEIFQELSLLLGFHSLCDYRQPHYLAEGDDGLGNGAATVIDK